MPKTESAYVTSNLDMLNPLRIADAGTIGLDPDPIPAEWLLGGTPKASSKVLARSHDRTLTLVVWECSSGRFHWNYAKDEILYVVSGSATTISEDGRERHFAVGDVVFFRAGTKCTWQIDDHIRKAAVLKDPLWTPLAVAVTIWRKLARSLWWRINRVAGKPPDVAKP
jgi:uncharacterized cupin superfamily protein